MTVNFYTSNLLKLLEKRHRHEKKTYRNFDFDNTPME